MKAVVALLALAAHAGATELTKETWDAETAGKTVFVKFLAPWCGHCKKMKPDWDKLMAEYKDSKTVLIADVDCTAGGKSLCESVGVRGYPTIKYGDPNNMEDYKGGRDLKALKGFAESNLGPQCGPANLDLCSDEKKKQIDEFMALSGADLKAKIAEKEAEMKKSDEDMTALTKSLQSRYEAGQKARDEKKAAIKEAGLGLMKAVLAHTKDNKAEL